jgi:hypothetical protein
LALRIEDPDHDTALMERVSVTPENVHGRREGSATLPDEPCDEFGDSAHQGQHFEGGVPRSALTSMSDRGDAKTLARYAPWNAFIQHVRAHREDLRHLEALLRPKAHAMAKPQPAAGVSGLRSPAGRDRGVSASRAGGGRC